MLSEKRRVHDASCADRSIVNMFAAASCVLGESLLSACSRHGRRVSPSPRPRVPRCAASLGAERRLVYTGGFAETHTRNRT